MKSISYSIAVIGIALSAAALSFGQSQSGTTAPVPPAAYEILDQPGCPLVINIDERMAQRVPAAPLKITNNDSSTVNAFVLHVKGGERFDHNEIVFILGKGIAPGEFYAKAVSIRGLADSPAKAVISVDYVHFADGKAWGADSLGKSKDVASFIKGHDLALARLKELLAGQDDTDFMKSIGAFRSSGYGESGPVNRGPRNIDFFARGYAEIINILRHTFKRADEGQELARKLELMESAHTR